MITDCGPDLDRRILNFSLPDYGTQSPFLEKLFLKQNNIKKDYRIGVLVSGGIDSALLYYLLLLENLNLENKFTITPYTILRKEGSRYYAQPVINFINKKFNLPFTGLNIVGDNTLDEAMQVFSGMREILSHNDFVYVGAIAARPEHLMGWAKWDPIETFREKYPFAKLEKSHIMDLIFQLNLEMLLTLTHSCAVNEKQPCLKCNGCLERQWGLETIGKPKFL